MQTQSHTSPASGFLRAKTDSINDPFIASVHAKIAAWKKCAQETAARRLKRSAPIRGAMPPMIPYMTGQMRSANKPTNLPIIGHCAWLRYGDPKIANSVQNAPMIRPKYPYTTRPTLKAEKGVTRLMRAINATAHGCSRSSGLGDIRSVARPSKAPEHDELAPLFSCDAPSAGCGGSRKLHAEFETWIGGEVSNFS